jgi:hypothetical protein
LSGASTSEARNAIPAAFRDIEGPVVEEGLPVPVDLLMASEVSSIFPAFEAFPRPHVHDEDL